MLSIDERERMVSLLRREVVPAIGCTEPVAVALCVARATELLQGVPEEINVELSTNILKNAMGVGIPGTGMIGLPIAIALGALVGKSSYGLEVLKDTTPQAVEAGKALIEAGIIHIHLKADAPDELYIEVHATCKEHQGEVTISGQHTHFVYEALDGRVLLDERCEVPADGSAQEEETLNLRKIYDFAMESPLDEIAFIEESARMNVAAAEAAFGGQYGHQLGNMLKADVGRKLVGTNVFAKIITYTCAACDARMAGAPIPVMSNSGSGNQGIAATLPVAVFARENHVEREPLIRALALSNLTAIYIKQSLGRLSALCGCIVASTGASCGITYLMGGDYTAICYAVKNMIANLTGMICDGAKPSCSMKLSSGVSTALFSALLAMEGHTVSKMEGIIDDDVDKSIRNLTGIGREAMQETNRMVLNIMTGKE